MDTSKIKEISQGIVEVKNAGNTVWGGVYVDTTNSPGPKKLIGGNEYAGFFGEVSTSELINGEELSKELGIYEGSLLHRDCGWLKFVYMRQIEFIAKKPIRHSISYNHLYYRNATHFGGIAFTIKGQSYSPRLIEGKTGGKQDDSTQWNGTILHNSEWNRLLLPICSDAPSNWRYPNNVKSPTEKWANYDPSELWFTTPAVSLLGPYNWCQEYGQSTSYRLFRGYGDITGSANGTPSGTSDNNSWRPVLVYCGD